ncbi:MAG: hypothetical protein RLN72_05025 [Henriciella sp.]
MGLFGTIRFRTLSYRPRLSPYLASAGINLLIVALVLAIPRSPAEDTTIEIIPVTLVEEPELLEEDITPPEDVPTPEPEATLPAIETRPPKPATQDSWWPAQDLQSPIIAAPDETADAQTSTDAVPALPSPPSPDVDQATAALQAFRCNRFGDDRPAFCDDQADPIKAVSQPAFAEQPNMIPKAWASFEIQQADMALTRLLAEDCPVSDGVINDVFVATTNPNLQGAASAVGSLSAGSAEPNCG